MDLCRNAPVDMLWGLLQLTHVHNCKAEMKWCCEAHCVLLCICSDP